MDKTDRLRDYGLAFLLYEQGLGLCGYELIRELFIFVKLILNSYLKNKFQRDSMLEKNSIWDVCDCSYLYINPHQLLAIRALSNKMEKSMIIII